MTVGVSAPFVIMPAATRGDFVAADRLFRDYAASLKIDLCFQDFEAELAALPGKYAPPKGALLLARNQQAEAIGCVALRPSAADRCEMKRLYVAPAARGGGLGKALMNAIVGEGRRIGYRAMRLDTLPQLTTALAMYEAAGFVRIAPYYATPVEGTIFLELDLQQTGDLEARFC